MSLQLILTSVMRQFLAANQAPDFYAAKLAEILLISQRYFLFLWFLYFVQINIENKMIKRLLSFHLIFLLLNVFYWRLTMSIDKLIHQRDQNDCQQLITKSQCHGQSCQKHSRQFEVCRGYFLHSRRDQACD